MCSPPGALHWSQRPPLAFKSRCSGFVPPLSEKTFTCSGLSLMKTRIPFVLRSAGQVYATVRLGVLVVSTGHHPLLLAGIARFPPYTWPGPRTKALAGEPPNSSAFVTEFEHETLPSEFTPATM